MDSRVPPLVAPLLGSWPLVNFDWRPGGRRRRRRRRKGVDEINHARPSILAPGSSGSMATGTLILQLRHSSPPSSPTPWRPVDETVALIDSNVA